MTEPQLAIGTRVSYWAETGDRLNGGQHTGTVVSLIGVSSESGCPVMVGIKPDEQYARVSADHTVLWTTRLVRNVTKETQCSNYRYTTC